jgi:DNA modification methylase
VATVIHTQDADFTLICADVLDGLQSLPDESVHCVVCSPPYWGLRDYGTGLWDGGDPDCDHKGAPLISDKSGLAGYTSENIKLRTFSVPQGDVCGKCGARRQDQQLGLEPTPDQYVARIVEVFREVRRVLRSDGTCWVNLGDSYAASRTYQVRDNKHTDVGNDMAASVPPGLKPKDLVGIPWRVAFALQADGWYLRSEITWCKPNCMPESVTDRPTKATEKVFLLTKAPRYYYDAEAIRTEHQRDGRAITEVIGRDGSLQHRNGERWPGTGANARDWWLIATEGFADAHFATFPTELVRRCILAGTSERGCCPVCGKPWERETGRDEQPQAYAPRKYDPDDPRFQTKRNLGGRYQAQLDKHPIRTLGWRPGCDCVGVLLQTPYTEGKTVNRPPVPIPCTVLDPFLGSGTTAYVARKHGRRSIGIELSPAYADLAARRMQQQSLFSETHG